MSLIYQKFSDCWSGKRTISCAVIPTHTHFPTPSVSPAGPLAVVGTMPFTTLLVGEIEEGVPGQTACCTTNTAALSADLAISSASTAPEY
ncbi:uncharacterized protein B0H18DRAFT_993784 [Fomitopsis serialis]|uniref:uncharacterized protein n=1 Tax=Fomitopsis serialis TaxID=139415 RepID=UPI002007C09D|nr:uncharacterized protein B0H18DRAFT_993784 [Neoantrodia serialis]KAH9930216.1 hypothetical protein B0H18DRAFT_993784 [Neoantrodia serialis]